MMNRIIGFDYLRVMAVFAVVWIHGSDTNSYAVALQSVSSFAVPCFIMMSAYLFQVGLLKTNGVSCTKTLINKFTRLLPSYLIWSVLYIILRVIKHHLIVKQPFDIDWLLFLVCGGSSYQLWFVPALVLWISIFVSVAKLATQFQNKLLVGTMLVLSGLLLLQCGAMLSDNISVASDYQLFIYSTVGYLGYFPIGMGLVYLFDKSKSHLLGEIISSSLYLKLLLSALFIWAIMKSVDSAIWFSGPVYSLALLTLFLTCNICSSSAWIKLLSTYAFGIYLCHAMFVEGLQMLLPSLGVNLESFHNTVLLIAVAFSMSAMLCVLLGRFKSTRWLVV